MQWLTLAVALAADPQPITFQRAYVPPVDRPLQVLDRFG